MTHHQTTDSIPADREGWTVVTRHYTRYEHLNSHGTFFGGKMAAFMDEAAVIYAMRITNTQQIVTLRIGELLFKEPVNLGDILEFSCRPRRKGRTSLTVDIKVERIHRSERRKIVCQADITFVNVDKAGRPSPWIN